MTAVYSTTCTTERHTATYRYVMTSKEYLAQGQTLFKYFELVFFRLCTAPENCVQTDRYSTELHWK